MKEQYLIDYNNFIDELGNVQKSSEDVGILVAKMAQYFADYNTKLSVAERALAMVAKEYASSADEATGKQITVAKAEILTAATEEYALRNQFKTHLVNCETFINALKSLQRGLSNEYGHMGNI